MRKVMIAIGLAAGLFAPILAGAVPASAVQSSPPATAKVKVTKGTITAKGSVSAGYELKSRTVTVKTARGALIARNAAQVKVKPGRYKTITTTTYRSVTHSTVAVRTTKATVVSGDFGTATCTFLAIGDEAAFALASCVDDAGVYPDQIGIYIPDWAIPLDAVEGDTIEGWPLAFQSFTKLTTSTINVPKVAYGMWRTVTTRSLVTVR